jgi:hypothetical protein
LLWKNIFESFLVKTGQFKKKATLSHVCNEVTSEPTITRYTTIVRKTQSLFVIDAGKCFGPPPPGKTVLQNGRLQKAFCCGLATRSPLAAAAAAGNTYPSQLQTLRVFLTIAVYRVIVGSLVTSL